MGGHARRSRGLTIIEGRRLPRLGWNSQGVPYHRRHFKQVANVERLAPPVDTKPQGGLWTSPMVEMRCPCHLGLTSLGTAFTAWADHNYGLRTLGPLYPVHPKPRAKVVLINDQRSLFALARAYPDDRDSLLQAHYPAQDGLPYGVDYARLAQDFDAIYVTRDGIRSNRDDLVFPSLWNWTVPTVYFLRPAFYVGRQLHVPDKEQRVAIMDRIQAVHDARLVRIMQQIARREGIELDDDDAQRFLAIQEFIAGAEQLVSSRR